MAAMTAASVPIARGAAFARAGPEARLTTRTAQRLRTSLIVGSGTKGRYGVDPSKAVSIHSSDASGTRSSERVSWAGLVLVARRASEVGDERA